MAVSRTPTLFARVDLFSRSRVMLFMRNNFQLPTKTPLEMTETVANCVQVVITKRVTDGSLDKFGTQVNSC